MEKVYNETRGMNANSDSEGKSNINRTENGQSGGDWGSNLDKAVFQFDLLRVTGSNRELTRNAAVEHSDGDEGDSHCDTDSTKSVDESGGLGMLALVLGPGEGEGSHHVGQLLLTDCWLSSASAAIDCASCRDGGTVGGRGAAGIRSTGNNKGSDGTVGDVCNTHKLG